MCQRCESLMNSMWRCSGTLTGRHRKGTPSERNASVEEIKTEHVRESLSRVRRSGFREKLESTRRCHSNATEIEHVYRVVQVVDVEKGCKPDREKYRKKPAAPTYLSTAMNSLIP